MSASPPSGGPAPTTPTSSTKAGASTTSPVGPEGGPSSTSPTTPLNNNITLTSALASIDGTPRSSVPEEEDRQVKGEKGVESGKEAKDGVEQEVDEEENDPDVLAAKALLSNIKCKNETLPIIPPHGNKRKLIKRVRISIIIVYYYLYLTNILYTILYILFDYYYYLIIYIYIYN